MGLISSLLGDVGVPTGGLIGQIGNGLSSNSNMLLGLATGGGQGAIRGAQLDAANALQQKEEDKIKQKIADAEALAPQFNVPVQFARAFPDLMAQIAAKKFSPRDPQIIGSAETGYTTWTPGQPLPENLTQGRPTIKEFDPDKRYAQVGRDGTVTWLDSGGAAGRGKAPSGYRWSQNDPTQLEPIPGGPAEQGKSLPAEMAGRVALAEGYLTKAPAIRDKIKSGYLTGPIDNSLAENGIGERGQVYADIQSGVDALQRGLTGAGMGEQEAARYAQRYLPTRTDSADTLLRKHDRLVDELERIRLKAYEGRGKVSRITPEVSFYPDSNSGAQGGPIGTNRATYGANAAKGRTSGGVTWAVRPSGW